MAAGRHEPTGTRHRPVWHLFSLVLLVAVAYWPLLIAPGLVNTRAGGDSPFLLVRVQQLVTALRAGAFPVRWMPDAAYGLGYPFFNFYAPLPFYIAAGFHFLGLGYIGAVEATQILGFLAAATGMFLLTRRLLGSSSAALLASLAYTYAPFHLVNVYVRGDSLGEFYAFAFYPLIFLALIRLHACPSLGGLSLLALLYGGLVLSHNLSALTFSPFVAVHILFLANFRPRFGTPASLGLRLRQAAGWVLWPAAGLALGMGLSAWYWGPALLEQRTVQLQQNLTGYFHYAGHFRRLDLVQPTISFDFSVTGQRTPFAMGSVQTLFTLLAVLSVAIHRVRRRRGPQPTSHYPLSTAYCSLLTAYWLLSTVLITPLSRPIWDRLPLMPFVQFPWRLLSVQSFFGSLLIGHLALLPRRARWRRDVAYALSLILLAASMANLRVEPLPITDADVTRERLMLYELFTANIGSTVRAEYLPQGVDPRPFTSAVLLNGGQKPPPLVLTGQVERAQLLTQSPVEQRWHITVTSPEAELAFFTLHFPGWRGYIDGHRVQVQAAKGSGFITTRVPQGSHEVVLRFWLTRRRAAAEAVSAGAVLFLLGALVWVRAYRRSTGARAEPTWQHSAPASLDGQSSGREPVRVVALAAVAFLLSVVVLWLRGRAGPLPPSPLTMDFARMPYLHANPDGLRFGDSLRLVGYEFPDRVEAGATLTVTLRWAGTGPEPAAASPEAEVALVSPAFHLFGVPDALASQTVPMQEVTTHRLDVPPGVVPGLYLILVRVHSDRGDWEPRTEAGEALGTTYLRPLSIGLPVTRATVGQGAITEPGSTLGQFGRSIRLAALAYEQAPAGWLRVNLTWWTGTTVAENYKTSLRLNDREGKTLVQADTEPLYGFYPTTVWQPGQLVADRRWLALPKDLAAGNDYRIEVVLYELPSLQALGTTEIGNVILK